MLKVDRVKTCNIKYENEWYNRYWLGIRDWMWNNVFCAERMTNKWHIVWLGMV